MLSAFVVAYSILCAIGAAGFGCIIYDKLTKKK